jgi:hypothetical protein
MVEFSASTAVEQQVAVFGPVAIIGKWQIDQIERSV